MILTLDEFFEKLLFYVSVPTCVCCKRRLTINESALCRECLAKRDDLKYHSCSRCGKKLDACACSNEYLENHYVKKLAKVFRYEQRDDRLPLNSLIYSLKRENRDDVLNFCADELVRSIRTVYPNASSYVITNVPRSKRSIVKYGIDHGALLAKAVADRLGARYENILVSNVKTEQKKLHGDSRKVNAKFSIKNDIDLTGMSVLIIDDIVTTGASMGASAMLLHGQGAKRVYGAALAIAFKDKYKPFLPIRYIKLQP